MSQLLQDSQRRIQLLRQSDPRQFPAPGTPPLVMTTWNLKRQAPDQARQEFRPVGYQADAWTALLRHYETFQGDISADYEQIDIVLEMLCGPPTLTASTMPGGPVQKRDYYVPESLIAAIQFFAIEHGYTRACKRMLYSLLTAFSMNVKRGNQPGITSAGTVMFNRPLRNTDGSENFQMTGTTPQSAVLQVLAANVGGDGVFALRIGGVLAGSLTFSINDTQATTIAKFAALGLTAAVAGGITSGAGEKHVLSGPSVTGNATIYGSVVVNPSTSTIVSVQAAIQALGGVKASAQVSGTISAPTVQSFTLSGLSSHNGNYSQSGTMNGAPRFNTAAGTDYYFFDGAQWRISGSGYGGSPDITLSGSATTPTAPGASSAVFSGVVSNPGAVNLTIQFPAAVGNVPGLEAIPGTGYTGTSTQPGSAGGALTVTVSAPTNTPVSLSFVSGAGYSSSIVQAGSNGQTVKPNPYPMLPQHFSVRRNANLAGLYAAPQLNGVRETVLDITAVLEPDQNFNEGELSYTDHVGGDIQITHKLTLVSDTLLPISDVQSMRDKADSTPAVAEWYQTRAVHPDKLHSFFYEGMFAVNAPYAPGAGGLVYQYEFPMKLMLNNELFAPDGTPAILHFCTTRPA